MASLGEQVVQAVTGPAGEHGQAWAGGGYRLRGFLRLPGGAGHGGRQHHEFGPGLIGELADFTGRQVAGQVMDEPAVLAQARCRHQRGQAVPFPGRSGDDRDTPGPPGGLAGVGRDQALADRAGAMFLSDGDPACLPLLADPVQRGRNDAFAQVDERYPGRQPFEAVARLRLLARSDQRVQPLCLGRPVTDVDGPGGLLAETAAGGQRRHVTVVELITPAYLPGRQHALAHPGIGGLVVHAEGSGGLAQIHPSSRVRPSREGPVPPAQNLSVI